MPAIKEIILSLGRTVLDNSEKKKEGGDCFALDVVRVLFFQIKILVVLVATNVEVCSFNIKMKIILRLRKWFIWLS